MTPERSQRLARIAGWLFIATFVTSIPAVLLYEPVLKHHDYILGAGHDTRISIGAFLEVFLAITNIGTAVALFPILKRRSETLALGYVASRTLESTVIVIGLVSVMSVVGLRQDVGGSGATDSASLVIAGRSLVELHDWTFLLGPSFCAGFGNGILLGYLLYTSGLVPRRFALLGLVGGPLAFLAASLALLGVYDKGAAAQGLLTVPEIIWEVSLGIYLIARGVRSDALSALDRPAGSTVPVG
jgi:hypothetical protein